MSKVLVKEHEEEVLALPFALGEEEPRSHSSGRIQQSSLVNIKSFKHSKDKSAVKSMQTSQDFLNSLPFPSTTIKTSSTEKDDQVKNSLKNNLPLLGQVRRTSDLFSPQITQKQRNGRFGSNYQNPMNKQFLSMNNHSPSLQVSSAMLQKTFFKAMNQPLPEKNIQSQNQEYFSKTMSQSNFQQYGNSTIKKDQIQMNSADSSNKNSEDYSSPETKTYNRPTGQNFQKKAILFNSQSSQRNHNAPSSMDASTNQQQQLHRELSSKAILSLQEIMDAKVHSTQTQSKKQILKQTYLEVPNINLKTPQIKIDGLPQFPLFSDEQNPQWKNVSTPQLTAGAKSSQTGGSSRIQSMDFTGSALISQEKANVIKEINEKKTNRNSFYGQFISLCFDQNKEVKNSPIKKGQKIFQTDLEKIKISSQLLDVISNQIFSAQDTEQENQPESNELRQLSQKKSKMVLNNIQKDKLFSVLANQEKIVVHTSQNKELMAPSDRKDVVRLAQWLEDMIEKVYEVKDLNFQDYFESVQLICSSCMSEIVRQVGIAMQERGMLIKRIWESLLNLMRQAFEKVAEERAEKEKSLQEENRQTHRMYLAKLDELMPQVGNLERKLENKELQNKRVVLEFRYLRKKDSKLEKYLKLSKKDLKNVEEEFQKFKNDYQAFQNTHLSNEKKGELKPQPSRVAFEIDSFNKNVENYTEEMKQLNERYRNDVKNFYSSNGKSNLKQDDLDQLEEKLYSTKEAATILEMDNRIIEQIEGSDGIKLVIGHCGTQTGPDLLKMTHQNVDTESLIQLKEKGNQTHSAEIDVKEVQTIEDWEFAQLKKDKNLEWENQQEIIVEGNSEAERRRQEVEEKDEQFLEEIKKMHLTDEDEKSEIQDKNICYSSTIVKAFLEEQDMNSNPSLIGNWKNEAKDSQQGQFIEILNTDKENDGQSPGRKSVVKIKETLSLTVENRVEEDLNELHLLVTSRTKYVTELLEKILKHNLLKENEIVSTANIKLFIDDSQVLILEENSRLKKIWERSKRGVLDLIKSKIAIAEKDAELKEVQNDKIVFEQKIKQIKRSMENIEEKKSDAEGTNKQKVPKISGFNTILGSTTSLQDITDEEEGDSSSDSDILCDDEGEVIQSPTHQKKDSVKRNSMQVQKIESNSPKKGQRNSILVTNRRTSIINPQVSNIKIKATEKRGSTVSKPINNAQAQQNQTKKQKKKETLNPLNRISVSIVEAVQQQSKQQQYLAPTSEDEIEKRYCKINRSKQNELSTQPGANGVQNWLKGITLSENKIQDQTVSSPNADSAALFFNKVAVKYLSKGSKNEGKRVVLKQQIVLKHIYNLYLEKVKFLRNNTSSTSVISNTNNQSQGNLPSLVNNTSVINSQIQNNNISICNEEDLEEDNSVGDENQGRTLNLLTYDYFLNQFGFKKLAESKLRQFLESCGYYSGVSARIRTFTKLYGFNRVTNFDFEDFDFFAKMLQFLEDGSTSQQLAAGIIPINRAIEALVKRFDGKIDITKFKQEIEMMKVQDTTQKIKNKFAVESDSSLDIYLQALVEEKKLQVQIIQNAFVAGDVDSDNALSLQEFQILMKHIESKTYNQLSATRYFMQHCDLLDQYTGTYLMSFNSFAHASLHSKLFRKRSQESFIQRVNSFDAIDKLEALENLWSDKKDIIRLRFVKHSAYKVAHRLMIKKIDDYLYSPVSTRTQSIKNATWFTYRLLDEESKRVMEDYLINSFIPIQFCDISESCNLIVKRLSSPAMV